jgi:GTP cyclohydrolase II
MKLTDNIRNILGIDSSPAREVSRNRKGVMVYLHKTGGQIQIHTAEAYNRNKVYFKPNGAFSAVKNFSRSIA